MYELIWKLKTAFHIGTLSKKDLQKIVKFDAQSFDPRKLMTLNAQSLRWDSLSVLSFISD